MKSAAYEAEPEPDEPFDYNAKPGTFYIEAEGTGSMPVKEVVRLVSPYPSRHMFLCGTTDTKIRDGIAIERRASRLWRTNWHR